MSVADIERAKYERIWKHPHYGNFSPGERLVDAFINIVQPDKSRLIIDFGCGGGKATRALQKRGYKVYATDHTRKGISAARWKHIKPYFTEACLWNLPELCDFRQGGKAGFCCDVMEHIPTEFVMLTIEQIMKHCDQCFFQITTLPDEFGKAIGEPLHLTVKPFLWWLNRLAEFGDVVDARDLMHAGVFHVR